MPSSSPVFSHLVMGLLLCASSLVVGVACQDSPEAGDASDGRETSGGSGTTGAGEGGVESTGSGGPVETGAADSSSSGDSGTATDTGAGERTQTATFEPDDTTDFINPERGWMERGDAENFASYRAGDDSHPTGYSVVWTPVGSPVWNGNAGNPFRLDNYRTQDLPAALLDGLQDVFAAARDAGIKLKVRFAYNYSGDGEDTTLQWMTTHVNQLGPVLSENADTIASMDAGFVGRWGEMHSSTDIVPAGGDEQAAIADLVEEILAQTPDTLSVGVRYPRIVRNLFGEENYELDLGEAFSGSDQSRVGWYNDCLWSNEGNTGTYSGVGDGNGQFELDRDTFEKVGRYAATSGESCNVGGINQFNACDAVIPDMVLIGGPDTLFRGFWGDMYERWIEEGCYDEVTRRLGYRLQLVSATFPEEVVPGMPFDGRLELRNTGFGKVYNPRPVDVVFVGEGHVATARLTEDSRPYLPLAGQTVEAQWTVDAPNDLIAGESYALYLRLPDPSARLESDERYTIRLANTNGIWDPDTGRHDLGMSVTVR
ncbi:MAG: DUF4832 domain-containing protein [Deltaproteobacteria bacterium]|nr:DUF4832 domain-containing protein [Deltaproteobacteria bacterium]